MACGCGKNKAKGAAARGAVAAGAAKRTASRPPVKRTVSPRSTSAAPERPTRDSPRPYNPMTYYVLHPDGTEVPHRTLAEAQTVIRRAGRGSGLRLESRRQTS